MCFVFHRCKHHPLVRDVLGQDGSSEDDVVMAVAVAADGSVALAGYTWGDWNGTNKGYSDFDAFKLDADGNLLWKWQVNQGSAFVL